MRRRTFLGAAGSCLTGLAGCAGSADPVETFTDVDPPVVTGSYRWYGGYSWIQSTTLFVEPGRIRYDVACRGETDEGRTVERAIDRDTYDAFRRRVTESEPNTWAEEYPCEGECATDIGWYEITVAVGSETHETDMRADADIPPRIDQLRDFFRDVEDRFDDIEECPETWTDR